jgi:hypothetical protein
MIGHSILNLSIIPTSRFYLSYIVIGKDKAISVTGRGGP